MNWQNKRVLVTGGAGFIGSNLCQELARRGGHILIVDDLSTGKEENIEALIGEEVSFVQGSVVDLPLLQELFHEIDIVFHLAAISDVPRSLQNPIATHQVNIAGTLNVLLAARDNKVRKVIYASSSSVYGDTPTLPKTEDMLPNPQSPYAATKLAGEYYCQVFGQVYDLSTVCLRYFNVYGPRQDSNPQYATVIPMFITGFLKDKPPTIFGDGEQTRDLTFVEDVVAANILAAESDVSGIFNVGTGEGITINELSQLIRTVIDKDIEPIHHEPRPGDVKHSLADITKAKEKLGWEPKIDLKEGLRRCVDWYETPLKTPRAPQ